jgi:hypothetical protein
LLSKLVLGNAAEYGHVLRVSPLTFAGWLGLFIMFFIVGWGASPHDDITPVAPGRRRLGYLTFAILATILLPFPHALWQAAGIHGPYL